MSTIAIIGDKHDWHSEQLETTFKKKGYAVLKIKFNQLRADFNNSEKNFLNPKFKKIRGIWLRFINKGPLEEITTKLTFLHLLEETGIYIHNSPKVIETTVDKVRTTGLLTINKINSPQTIVEIGKITRFKKNNYLLKPIFGSQGKDISFIKSKSKLNKANVIGNVSYLQKFIGNPNQNNYSDIRVLISNHRPISIMKRTSKIMFTNAFQGASVSKLTITEELKRISIKVSKIFKLGYGGIDLKYFRKKYYVLEVNSIPSWKAIQGVENKNISQILVNDFLKRIK